MHVVCANIFGTNVLESRFKIDVVIMIICSIVIIINSVLTLQVSTAKYPNRIPDCDSFHGQLDMSSPRPTRAPSGGIPAS